jgi:hypothetical protein
VTAPQYWSASADTHTADGEELDDSRPQFSFTCLIGLAILASEAKELSVVQIYEYIARNFPFYKTAKTTWRNSVRHVLSLGKFFQKPRAAGATKSSQPSAKGGAWEIAPEMFLLLIEHVAEGQQRLSPATCRHLGLPDLKRTPMAKRARNHNRIGKGRPQHVPQQPPPQQQHHHQTKIEATSLGLDELTSGATLELDIDSCISEDGFSDSMSSIASSPPPSSDPDICFADTDLGSYNMISDVLCAMDAADKTTSNPNLFSALPTLSGFVF